MITDLWLSYTLARSGAAFAYVNERLTNYRVHGSSVTAHGLAEPEDYVFDHMIAGCRELSVATDLQQRWAQLRWGRAVRLMGDGRRAAQSRAELRAAAPHLAGPKRAAAALGGRSQLVWRLLSILQRAQREAPETPAEQVTNQATKDLAA
jgi:hypothetical protein